jgi:hypothetical protein
MTGTVAGVTAYQWDAGGQWRVLSANCPTISSRPYQFATGCREERVQIVWPISAIPILNCGT